MSIRIAAFGVLGALVASPAFAGGVPACTPDPYTIRMSPAQASARAKLMGYKVVAVEPDAGCFRVEARDDRGRRTVLLLHAGTGEMMARVDPLSVDRIATASTK